MKELKDQELKDQELKDQVKKIQNILFPSSNGKRYSVFVDPGLQYRSIHLMLRQSYGCRWNTKLKLWISPKFLYQREINKFIYFCRSNHLEAKPYLGEIKKNDFSDNAGTFSWYGKNTDMAKELRKIEQKKERNSSTSKYWCKH